tara:strand:- start:340 stop:537 length:198 start_codon:yes stop_codon:yes gene_type:complete
MALPLIPLALTAARVIARNKKARKLLSSSVQAARNALGNTKDVVTAGAAFETGRQIEKARRRRKK